MQDTCNAQFDWNDDADAREQQAQFQKLKSKLSEQAKMVARDEQAIVAEKEALETAGLERTKDFGSDLEEGSTLTDEDDEREWNGRNGTGKAQDRYRKLKHELSE